MGHRGGVSSSHGRQGRGREALALVLVLALGLGGCQEGNPGRAVPGRGRGPAGKAAHAAGAVEAQPRPGGKNLLPVPGSPPWRPARPGPGPRASSQAVFVQQDGPVLALRAGNDGRAAWRVPLSPCEPGRRYGFTAQVAKAGLDGSSYPEVAIWGQRFRLNTVVAPGRFLPVYQSLDCPQNPRQAPWFSFFLPHDQGQAWMRSPRLVPLDRDLLPRPRPWPGAFPLGAYGGRADNLADMAAMGLDQAVLPPDPALVLQARDLGLAVLVDVPRSPGALARWLDGPARDLMARLRARGLDREGLAFYVNDEPGFNGFPPDQALEISRLLRRRFPGIPQAMAVVRPQVLPWFARAADYFMLDQYPVPHMPLVWQADALDEAADLVGRERLMAVIQAFGGPGHARFGWPRRPSRQELDCLAFLALIHGARGLWYFTFEEMCRDRRGREVLAGHVRRMRGFGPWLGRGNVRPGPRVEQVPLRYGDAATREAVHCALRRGPAADLLLCANASPYPARARIQLLPDRVGGPMDLREYPAGRPWWRGPGDSFEYEFAGHEALALLCRWRDRSVSAGP